MGISRSSSRFPPAVCATEGDFAMVVEKPSSVIQNVSNSSGPSQAPMAQKKVYKGARRPLTKEERRIKQGRLLFMPREISSQLRCYDMVPPPLRRRTGTTIKTDIEEHHMLIKYPFFHPGYAVVETSSKSKLHFVPQTFPAPVFDELDGHKPLETFTKSEFGIRLDAYTCTNTDPVVLWPYHPTDPNPSFITLELHYPGLPANFHSSIRYHFEYGTKHRQSLFEAAKALVKMVVDKCRASSVSMAPGFEQWDPVRIYDNKAFRLLGFKHIQGDRFLIALCVSIDYIPLPRNFYPLHPLPVSLSGHSLLSLHAVAPPHF